MYKVSVTRKHIWRGKKGKASSCPVALALREHFPGANVGFSFIELYDGPVDDIGLPFSGDSADRLYRTGYNGEGFPRRVGRFVRKFDKFGRKAVKPFSFFLKEDFGKEETKG